MRVPGDRPCPAHATADQLALGTQLDMSISARPSSPISPGVTTPQILEAVQEGAGDAPRAHRVSGLTKPQMACDAGLLLPGSRWLPELSRRPANSVIAGTENLQIGERA